MRLDRFFTRVDGRLKAIRFCDILFIIAKKNYSEIHTANGRYFIYVSIKCLEEKLPPNLFLRTHRSCIVAIDRIDEIDHNQIFIDKHTLPLTQKNHEELLKRILVICTERENAHLNNISAPFKELDTN